MSASAHAPDRNRVPEVGAPPPMAFPEVQDYTLGNGVRVVLWERRALPLVSLELQLRGGSATHAAGEAGLAAFTADMIDEGTARRTALEIADAVDVLGAALVSSAGYDTSQVRLSLLRDKLPAGLDVMADIVTRPSFPEDELVRVRQERIGRVLQRSAEPAVVAEEAFARVLYGGDHPYGASLLGTRESLAGVTRDDIVAFHGARYVPPGATLVVVGDIGREALDPLVEEAFSAWEGPAAAAPPLPAVPPAGRAIHLVDRPGAAQSEVRVGYVAADRRTPDYFPLTVMNTVLGGAFTSRLNMKLREEKGYTYGAGSTFDLRAAPGPFEAGTAVATEVTAPAVADLLGEIRRLRDEAVPADELVRVRNFLALRLPQRFESVDDVARRLAELVAYDVPLGFYAGYVDGVNGVDQEAVQRVAERYLPLERMAVVVVGDRARIEEPLRALDLGPVTVVQDAAGNGEPHPSKREEQ